MKAIGLLAWLGLGTVVLCGSAWAQGVPPALMVQQDGRSVPLGLAKVQTEVRIVGLVAETRTTMTFTNRLPRVMEGNLVFPLPEGAAISGYALDIHGAMVDGVAVEKHEARRVFEDVVRQGIDPGLVEWTKGNNFQTRVFPIPAGGSRTIRVEYVTELLGGKETPAYHLPLAFKDKLPEFSLRVEVVKPAAAAHVTKGELANFAFAKWQESYVAETKQQDVMLVEDLVVALPKAEQAQVVVEKAEDGQTYFAIHDEPATPAAELPVSVAKRVVLFWDASGSRAGDHQREIAVLAGYLGRLIGAAETKIAVDLVLLRNAASKPVRIELSAADAAALRGELQKVAYDGGTQLGAIAPLAGAEKPELYLLCTDGISNFGPEEPARLDAPLVIFSASAAANHSLLHSLAMSNGGRYFNLANWKDAEIFAQAGRSAWSFLSTSIEGGEVHDLYPQRAQPTAGRLTLVGKLAAERATVTVRYGIQGGQSDSRKFVVTRAAAAEGSLLRRLWAQKKLAELMLFAKRNEKEITALGKQFGLVTPHTSLLVLDSLEQYVQHEIAPPKSLATMREEYLRRIDTLEHQKQKQKGDKLGEVVRMWEERVKWWNTEFKYPKDFRYAAKSPEGRLSEAATTSGRVSGMRRAMVPSSGRPADAPKPAPAAPAPAVLEPEPAPRPQEASEGRDAAKAAAPAPGLAPGHASSDAPMRMVRPSPAGGLRAAQQMERLSSSAPATGEDRSGEGMNNGGEGQGGRQASRQPGIAIKAWDPETPYLKELRAAQGKADVFAVYLANRAKYGTSPAFFLDCADFLREANQAELALQVLSNIAELQLEDAALLRVLGYRLAQIGQLDLAVQTFEQVLALRPEEPQSCRDLALTLARRAEEATKDHSRTAEAIRADYARAIDLWIRVVLTRWNERFAEIELIALEEVNHAIPQAKAAGVSDIPLDPRLIKLLDVDVRIVMTWQADATDIDLWVTEPSGEKAFYSHNRTTIGGLVSRDFTGGYGPEEYMLRRAPHGTYKIEANYYGSRATRLLGAITVQADVYTNYGRENEQRKSLTLRLKDARETVPIGDVEF